MPPGCWCGRCWGPSRIRGAPDPLGMAAGRAAKLATGGYAGGRPPFGWRAEGKQLVPDEREQEIIALARQLTREGLSSRQVAARLKEAGHRPKAGGRWSSVQVGRILREGARQCWGSPSRAKGLEVRPHGEMVSCTPGCGATLWPSELGRAAQRNSTPAPAGPRQPLARAATRVMARSRGQIAAVLAAAPEKAGTQAFPYRPCRWPSGGAGGRAPGTKTTLIPRAVDDQRAVRTGGEPWRSGCSWISRERPPISTTR